MRSRNRWRPRADGGPVTRDIILGVLSLILWSLVLVVTVKYVFILLRADNKGEGGTLTLVALAQRAIGKRRGLVVMLGIIGAGLFYGDAVLTPAISVLSAVEGLKLADPDARPLRGADHPGDPDRPVLRAEPRAPAGSRPSSAPSC